MSDSIENFETILKKHTIKKHSCLYRDKKHKEHSLKPQDVISSVFSQIKAIHVADSLRSEKYNLQKSKKSTFLCVNKLPVYDQVQRQTTKFDTQCVSDTQLINIIEDAEFIDVQRGMTQEFETSFCHHTEKQNIEDYEETSGLHLKDNTAVCLDIYPVSNEEIVDGIQQKNTLGLKRNNIEADDSSIISPILCSNKIIGKENSINSQDSENNKNTQVQESTEEINKYVETEETDGDEDVFIKTPLSPIFLHKHVKTKSKTPSPLIFSLDKFEQFEKIAIPILEANDPKIAKHVINSQILDNELHIKLNEEILLNERDIRSPVLENKNRKDVHSTDINSKTDASHTLQAQNLELIELDKETSEELVAKIMENSNSNDHSKGESEILKDEILFSSDEEDKHVHKSYQDLPFTCALETSFYNQSDVLDKTMYVGFQTASDKAIQIFTESFAQAKSFLSDVTSDEITVTDLVKNCDSSNIKKKTEDLKAEEKELIDHGISKKTKFNIVTDKSAQTSKQGQESIKVHSQGSNNCNLVLKSDYVHFKTASEKEITLSDIALARSNRVFQDIDLSENFDTQIEKNEMLNKIEKSNEEIQNEDNISDGAANKSFVDNVIDDVVIQEFENIEMSLEEDKLAEKNVDSVGFKTASNKEIKISEIALTKIKDVFKDIDFDKDLNDTDIRETHVERNAILKMTKDGRNEISAINDIFIDIDSTGFPNKCSKSTQNNDEIFYGFNQPLTREPCIVGFKTANNRDIKIQDQAIAKTKTIFEDIDSIDFKFPKKNFKNLECDQASTIKTSVLSFKNINFSSEAVAKTTDVFKDIDSVDPHLPTMNINDNMQDKGTGELEDFNQLYASSVQKNNTSKKKCTTNELDFIGFKTANDRRIMITDSALAKTKNIFKGIKSDDFKYTLKSNKTIEEKITRDDECFKVEMIDYNKPSTSKTNEPAIAVVKKKTMSCNKTEFIESNKPSTSKACAGNSKTASTKNINIPEEVIAKAKNVFKDIHVSDYNFSKKPNTDVQITNGEKNDLDTDFNIPEIVGFKTANNKAIKISESAFAKTKNIFKEIESTEFQLQIKLKDDYPTITKEEYDNNIESRYNVNLLSEKNKNNYNRCYIPESTVPKFQGFQTASNKQVKISADALLKSRKLFHDLYMTQHTESKQVEQKYRKDNENEEISRSYADGKASPVFKELTIRKGEFDSAIEYSNKINLLNKDCFEGDIIAEQKDIGENKNTKKNILETTLPKFQGFQTASNKQVKISADVLLKSRKLLQDLNMNEDFIIERKQIGQKVGKHTDNEEIRKGMRSTYSFEKDSPVFKEFGPKNKLEDDFLTFREVKFDNNIESGPNRDSVCFKGDVIPIEKYIAENNNAGKFVPETIVPKFQGFQTASNKQVKVSADALVKSRNVFQDLNISQDYNIENKQIQKQYGDCTENVEISKDEKVSYADGKASPVFKGFLTANKKPVAISKKALARSKKLFEDIHTKSDDAEREFHGLNITNDKVSVSENALTKTNHLFPSKQKDNKSYKGLQTVQCRNIDLEAEKDVKIDNSFKSRSNINFGFKTGTNHDVLISKEAIARTKRLFSDIDNANVNLLHNKKEKKTKDEVVENIIDTQVLNHFEESLHTEDFHDTPIKSKRSGSPILSCPKAKKRKNFETPYSQIVPKPEMIKKDFINKNVNTIMFNETYKKNKKYKLKDLAISKSDSTLIDPCFHQLTFDNLLQFVFKDKRNGLSNEVMTVDIIKELFQNSVNSKLIPDGWLDNHIKLILWKLISYEIRFKAIVCNARTLVDQLKYRYDKELYNAQRPALRKILEKDDVASKTLVLCVAGIYVDGVNVASATTTDNIELLLTDGWYCVKASIDKMLTQLVHQGKIDVGTKIVTNGAELVNCEQGISPWEDTSAVRLKLFGNSTRRAHWDARLGYHGNSAIFCQLSSVKLDGGKLSKLRVFVTRVYPALYVEKFEDGSTVTRSERLEHLHQMKSEAERQAVMEKIYEEVEREFSDRESQDSENLSDSSSKGTCLDSGSQIAKVVKRSKDPAEFRAALTSSQSRLLEAHASKHRELLLQDIHEKIRVKIEKAGVSVNRNVVTLLKIRVAGMMEKNGVEVTKGMMSIWKPNDAILEIVKEGAWLDVMNVVPTAIRYSEIQISAGRQSMFNISKYKEPDKYKPYIQLLQRNCYTTKDLSQNPLMTTDYNEIDTVGFIFLVDPAIHEFDSAKQPFQNIYLADADKNMICINFWGGLKKFGYQNVLDTGQIVACANLQKRSGNTRKSIPQYRVTEFSYFTKSPKNEKARIILDDINKKFSGLDKRKFCEDCVLLKNNYTVFKHNNENMSPYRINNSDFNLSKNKIFIDSPLARPNKMDDNFNLTGLDFESTFKQTDTQNLPENVLLRKKKVNEKIARLKMYGEPPPLSTMHIINKSKNASSSYKSPLLSNNNASKLIPDSKPDISEPLHSNFDSTVNVASVKETPGKCADSIESNIMCSPLLLNKTFVKSVNPIRINFDVKDNNDSNVDHFAGEFDGSPPLSLD